VARVYHPIEGIALLLYVLSLFVMLMVLPATALATTLAGPRSHADLEGVLRCRKCHAFGPGLQELKYSSCHMEIMERVKSG
jgi:hypothetical protein